MLWLGKNRYENGNGLYFKDKRHLSLGHKYLDPTDNEVTFQSRSQISSKQ